MAAIHDNGRTFDNMDDAEVARLMALAQVAADTNKCVSAGRQTQGKGTGSRRSPPRAGHGNIGRCR